LESVLLKTPNELNNTDKLKYITTHVAVSASIASNIPGFINTEFISSTNPRDLCDQLINYFDQLSAAAAIIMHNQFIELLSLDWSLKLRNKLIDYCSSLLIIGFNSSFYDVDLLAKDGFINNIIFRDNNPFIIKDCNRYKVIKTNQFIFLDQMSYTAADTSLKKFIKAYDINIKKGKFLYEWFDSYDELSYIVQDSKHSDFYSSLKNKNIKLSSYNNSMEYCKNNNIIYIHELLKWYNNLNVEPMLHAFLKQKEFFYTFKSDMYKDAYSPPSLSENIMCQFSLIEFEKKH